MPDRVGEQHRTIAHVTESINCF